jgi:membrane protein DedA with SNARE-associated domain
MENIEFIEYLNDLLELLITRYGVLGIAAAMFAESAGVPFASAVVLLTSGTMILRGSVSFWSIFLASTIGITFGSIFSYVLGLLGSMIGSAVRTSFFNNKSVPPDYNSGTPHRSKIAGLWEKYGNFSIFMAQLWGFTRTFISFPAGAMHMNFYLFVAYTFFGGAIFSLLAITLSIILTRTMGFTIMILRLLADLSPWLLTIPAAMVAAVIYYYLTRHKKSRFRFLQNWRHKLKERSSNE